ncbi:hypothetical protein SAMN04488552_0398 [Christiangramia echinicola]|uniref:Uncharacterized protein n=1 Tax=Christiangramia echinicola TaxID=279359 RepID=A0A1H1KZJ5_9FLAO|nr:hypothetical protein SAMN04488552_0398 [Christiangramia echinicola]
MNRNLFFKNLDHDLYTVKNNFNQNKYYLDFLKSC